MKKILLKVMLIGCFVGASLLFAGEAGQVVTVLGDVTANGKELSQNDRINEADVVKTGGESKVKLLMVDRSVLDVGPQTFITVGKYANTTNGDRDVELELETGSVRALIAKKEQKAKNKFNFRTKWGVMAVRGTELRMDVGDSSGKKVLKAIFSEGSGTFDAMNAKGEVYKSFTLGAEEMNRLVIPDLDRAYSGDLSIIEVKAVPKNDAKAEVNASRIAENTYKDAVDADEEGKRKPPKQKGEGEKGRGPASESLIKSTLEKIAIKTDETTLGGDIFLISNKERLADPTLSLGSVSASKNSASATGGTVGSAGGGAGADAASVITSTKGSTVKIRVKLEIP